MPAPLVSIENNIRGFNTQRDWLSYEDWHKEMVKEEQGVRDINWCHLFDTRTGDKVATYRRGASDYRTVPRPR